MKNKKVIVTLITSIILMLMFFTIVSKNGIIIREKKIIKEMNESTQVTQLNTQITNLNKEHEDYLNYIQTCKTAIATALTNEGVETSDQILLEDMATNIPKILQARTKDATATAEDIAEGKTAYVNGELINGNMKNSFELELVKKFEYSGNRVKSKKFTIDLTPGTYYITGVTAFTGNSTDYTQMDLSRSMNNTWTYENCEIISNVTNCPTVVYVENDATVGITVTISATSNSDFRSLIYFSVLRLV